MDFAVHVQQSQRAEMPRGTAETLHRGQSTCSKPDLRPISVNPEHSQSTPVTRQFICACTTMPRVLQMYCMYVCSLATNAPLPVLWGFLFGFLNVPYL